MTSKSSKALPFLVLLIVAGSLWFEVQYKTTVNLETVIPVLVAIGVSGAGLKAVERASNARKQLPSDIEKIIKDRIDEAQATLTSRIDTKLSH